MIISKKLWWVLLATLFFAPARLDAQEVTVDALMRLRSVSDVQISPDGKQIAYVVSTPSLETAAHEAILYRIPLMLNNEKWSQGPKIKLNAPDPATIWGTRAVWSPDGAHVVLIPVEPNGSFGSGKEIEPSKAFVIDISGPVVKAVIDVDQVWAMGGMELPPRPLESVV